MGDGRLDAELLAQVRARGARARRATAPRARCTSRHCPRRRCRSSRRARRGPRASGGGTRSPSASTRAAARAVRRWAPSRPCAGASCGRSRRDGGHEDRQRAVGRDDHALGADAAARRLQHEGRAVALAERRGDGRVLEDARAARLGAVRERADPACRLHRAVLGRDVARSVPGRAARPGGRRRSRARRGSRPRAAPRCPRAGARSPPSRRRAAGCRAAGRGRSRRARSAIASTSRWASIVAAWIRRASSWPKRRRASLWNGAVPAITKPPFRPLAPEPAVRASSTVAETPCCARCQAVEMPPTPAPITQTSTSRSTSSGPRAS